MKKVLVFIVTLITLASYSQDSVKVTIALQARDAEFIASIIFTDNGQEEMYDSLKTKWRNIPNPPTGTNTLNITAYTTDFLSLYRRLNDNTVSIKSGTVSRLKASLIAVNQVYLTGKLNDEDIKDTDTFQAGRVFGRSRLKRQ